MGNHRMKGEEEQQTQLLLAEEERDKLKERQNPFCLLGSVWLSVLCAVVGKRGQGEWMNGAAASPL